MYGLPKDVDLIFLEDRKLLQICVGLHELILNFDSNTSITIMSSISISIDCNERLRFDEYNLAIPYILKLLNKKIEKLNTSSDGTLILFLGATQLILFDDNRSHESYTIKIDKKLIVV